jgi:hypothetical protein
MLSHTNIIYGNAHLPMAKEMLSICATLEPTLIRNRPGSSSSALVIVPCFTSTPFGTPVLPGEVCQLVRYLVAMSDLPDVYMA